MSLPSTSILPSRAIEPPSQSRMLVVEDDRDLAEIVGRIAGVVTEDLRVDVAETGAIARQLLSEHRYDFVLLDNFLDAGEQGVDLIEVVREQQPDAGLAMMSSMDLMRLIDLTSHERSVQILPKPFSLQLLKAFLHDVLMPSGRLSQRPVSII
ncbi:MAG: response regulator [Myxococcota bacterium]